MTDKTWKKVEREVAALLGGQRVPITGRQRGSAPDVQHPDLSIEVKHREELPAWLFDAMDQADKSNDGTKIPIAILHQKGMKYTGCLTVLRLSDILALLDKIKKLERDLEIAVDDFHSLARQMYD